MKCMEKPKSPCRDCPDRAVLCHSTCEKYIAYRNKQDDYNELVREGRDFENMKYVCDRRSQEIKKKLHRKGLK